MDLISELPDSLLVSILLLLPAKDAIRTCILSSRWYDLRKEYPLRLHIETDQQTCYRVNLAAARSAALYPGPIHSLCMSKYRTPFDADQLVEVVTKKGIRELVLDFKDILQPRYCLPTSLLQSQSLEKVSMSGCFFRRRSAVPYCNLPNLRELTLEFFFLPDGLLECLLKSCPRLEVLELINCDTLENVNLNCTKLRTFTIDGYRVRFLKKLTVEYAPELRKLWIGVKSLNTRISVQHAPKLEALGLFNMDATMRIGNTFIKSDKLLEMTVNKSMVLPTVKKLAIIVDFSDGDKCSLFSEVLSCFPCLETLYIKSRMPSGELPEADLWEKQIPFSILECHLKSVIMVNFCGLRPQVVFVKFLVQHGRVLETITLVCENKMWVTDEETLLCELNLTNRASMDLKVVFLSDTEFYSGSCKWTPLYDRPVETH